MGTLRLLESVFTPNFGRGDPIKKKFHPDEKSLLQTSSDIVFGFVFQSGAPFYPAEENPP